MIAQIILISIISLIGILTFYNGYIYDLIKNKFDKEDNDELIEFSVFQQWKEEYAKSYRSHEEEIIRFQIWKNNFKFVNEFNSNKSNSFTLRINHFGDLTLPEFKALHLGYLGQDNYNKNTIPLEINELPDQVDWRKNGAVTPIKNQKYCGSCWAFSATGALEGLHYLKSGNLVSLSEQQLVDCSKAYGNLGCGGGLMDYAFNYTKDYGIESEASIPYIGWPRTCSYSKDEIVFKNDGWIDVPEEDLDQLAAAVSKQPISVGIEADSLTFMFYFGGIYDSRICGTSLDHGVLLVGYGNNGYGKDYWIIKNSWGKLWGERGYIRMKKTNGTGPGMCGIAKAASYPTLENLHKDSSKDNEDANKVIA